MCGGIDCAVVGYPVSLQVEALALINAAFGDGSASVGSGDGLAGASDLRSRQPLGSPLVCPNDLPAIDFLILGKIPRCSLLVGSPCIERFIEGGLLSGGAILNRTILHTQSDNATSDLNYRSGGAPRKRLFTTLGIAEQCARRAASPFRSFDDLAANEVLRVGCAVGLDIGALLPALRVQIDDRLLVARPDVVGVQLGECGGSLVGILPFSVYRAGRSGKSSVDSFDRGDAVSFDSGDASNPIGESVQFAGIIGSPGARQLAYELSLCLRPLSLIVDGGRYSGAIQLYSRSDQSASPA